MTHPYCSAVEPALDGPPGHATVVRGTKRPREPALAPAAKAQPEQSPGCIAKTVRAFIREPCTGTRGMHVSHPLMSRGPECCVGLVWLVASSGPGVRLPIGQNNARVRRDLALPLSAEQLLICVANPTQNRKAALLRIALSPQHNSRAHARACVCCELAGEYHV